MLVLHCCWEDIPGGGINRHFQLVLPAKLVNDILECLHNTLVGGHMGERKTMEKVRACFYQLGQRRERYRNCASCTSRKSPSPLELR